MRAFVITIPMEQSEKAARRCIKSGKKFGLDIELFMGYTPSDHPIMIAEELGIPVDNFKEVYSRFDRCVAAFLSHRRLWEWSASNNTEVLIFEHDAVIQDEIRQVPHKGVLSYGHPSYGKWVTPSTLGVNDLVSKQYLPGAHAYAVKPLAAKIMLEKAKQEACPTDLFISNKNFNFVQEYYPWPVVADDSFTTIQNTTGCAAKHNYGETYEII